MTNAAVNHYADDLGEVMQLAKTNSTYSPFDSDAQQYFVAHVYALEVAKGGDACIGDIGGAPATPATSAAPAATTAADCHTHADGSE